MIKILVFKDKKLEFLDSSSQIPELLKDPDAMVWIDIEEGGQEEIDVLKNYFQFHPLAIEDCIHESLHPKIDNFGEYLFMEMHAVNPSSHAGEVLLSEINFFLGRNYLASYHMTPVKGLEKNMQKCMNLPEQTIGRGVDFLLYLLLDGIIDEYLVTLESLDDRIIQVEDEIFKKTPVEPLNNIFNLKKEILPIRRIVRPHRDILNFLSRDESPVINKKNQIYFRDVYDHLFRIYELIENYRELINGAMEIYLSVISNRMTAASNKMNEIMKTLTIVATIMMPLTVVVGLYGMNFKYMPEIEWKHGYPFVLGLMAVITLLMLLFMKKRKWL